MIAGEQQKREIETIAPRKIEINLSEADVERLAQKAELAGLTVTQLLESFIGDLVDGTYSNGSDERYRAQEWYERCGYGYYDCISFTGFLISEWIYEEFEELEEEKEDFQFEIDCGENEPEEVTEYKILLEERKEEIARICNRFNETMEKHNRKPATIEECENDFKRYKEQLTILLKGGK